MSAKPESALQTKIRKELLEAYPGSIVWKIHGSSFQRAGIPDLVGCIDGRFFGLEVKMPGREGTLTVRQDAALRGIRAAGGVAEVVTTPAQALEAVNPYLGLI